MSTLVLFGRSSSHFTRVVRLLAHELDIALNLQVIPDLTSTRAADYGGHPAFKFPVLHRDTEIVFGTESIARALAALAPQRRVVFDEQLGTNQLRNAAELLAIAMSAQVQWVFGTQVCGLPADNTYFAKGREGYAGAMAWLEAHVDALLNDLPERHISLFEIKLFCQLEHMRFRGTLPLDPFPRLRAYAEAWAARASAQATAYRFDVV